MAVVEGDEFQIPIKIDDQASKTLVNLENIASKTAVKIGAAVTAINQAWELAGRAVAKVEQAYDKTLGAAVNLQKGLAEVATLIGGDVAQATAKLSDELLALQSQFGTKQADLVKGYYQAISSGAVDASNATELLTIANKLAVGGVTSLTTAVDGLTNIMNAYGLGADSATNISDALFIGMKAGKTTIDELSRSLGNVASLASASNISFEELIGAVSALTTSGIETTTAVVQLRGAITSLSKPTENLQKVYQKLNITSIQNTLSQQGLQKTLQQIIKQTDGTTESLTTLFGSIEAVNGVIALTSNTIGGKFTKIMEDMGKAAENTGQTTEEAFKKIADTTEYRLNLISANIQVLGTQIGLALLPAFNAILDAVQRFSAFAIESFERLRRAINAIDFQSLIDKSDVLVEAVGVLGTALAVAFGPQIVTSIGAMTTAMAGYATAALAAVGPTLALSAQFIAIGAAVAGAVAVIEIFIRNINNLPALGQLALDVFENLFIRTEMGFSQLAQGILELLDPVFTALNRMGVVSNEALKTFRDNVEHNRRVVENFAATVEASNQKIAASAKGIDFGFSGEVVTQAINGFKALTSSSDQMGKAVENAGKKSVQAAKNIQAIGRVNEELAKKQSEAIAKIAMMSKQFEAERLEAAGRFVDAQVIRNDIALSTFDKEVAALKETYKLREDELAIINETRKALIEKGKAEIGKAQVREEKAQEKATGGVGAVFSRQNVEVITQAFGEGAGQAAAGISGALAGFTAPIAAANVIVDAFQGLVDAIPQLLSKISNLFNSLTDLPNQIVAGLDGLVDAVSNLLANFIPNLAKALPKIIRSLLIELPNAITRGLLELAKALPGILLELYKELPSLISDIITGMVERMGEIAAHLIKEAPKIALALAKAIVIELPKAIVEGILQALASLGGVFAKMFGNIFPAKAIVDGVKEIGDSIARSTSQLFQVVDAEVISRGLDAADRIRNAILSSTRKAVGLLDQAWEALKQAGRWLDENIWQPAWEGLKAAGRWLDENVWQPIIATLTWVFENVIKPIWDAVIAALTLVFEQIVKPIWDAVISALTFVFEQIVKPLWDGIILALTAVWDMVKLLFDGIIAAFQLLWDGVKVIFDVIIDGFKLLWDGVEAIFDVVISAFDLLWDGVKVIFDGIIGAFEAVWELAKAAFDGIILLLKGVWEIAKAVFDGIVTVLKGAWDAAKVVFDKIGDAMRAVWDGAKAVFDKIGEGLRAVWDAATSVFDAIGKGLTAVWDGITSIFQPVIDFFKNLKWPSFETPEWLDKFIKAINKFVDFISFDAGGFVGKVGNFAKTGIQKAGKAIQKAGDFVGSAVKSGASAVSTGAGKAVKFVKSLFADGGIVEGAKRIQIPTGKVIDGVLHAQTGAFSGLGTDTIPARLTPGEFVVNRDATRNNLGLLSYINSTNAAVTPQGGATSISVTINAKTNLTVDQIRREIVPEIEKQLKRKSQEGRFVIAGSGIRA